ncbi:hypothetical protein [Streptomyces chryseus]
MPSLVQELSGDRDLGGLRILLNCPFKATVLREGPAQVSGPGAAWLAYLCPVHTVDLDGWPGATDHADSGTMPCGTVLDFRSGEERLQSHADLWLTRLTGIDPAAYGGVWSDVLHHADRVLRARIAEAESAGGEASPLRSMLPSIASARRSAARGEFGVAATGLGCCETLAQYL